MSAEVGQDWRPKTLKELFVQWQAVKLESWHHTAQIKGSLVADKKTKYEDLHPFLRKVKSSGPKIETKPLFRE